MKNNYRYLLSLLLVILLGTCQGDKPKESITSDGFRVTLKLQAPDRGLKSIVSKKEGSLDLDVRFDQDDEVAIFVQQGDEIEDLGNIKFAKLVNDGKGVLVTFDIPATFDQDSPMTIIGYTGMNSSIFDSGNRPNIKLDRKNLLMNAAPTTPTRLEKFQPPLLFRLENVVSTSDLVDEMAVVFEHIGAYELVHFTNNSTSTLNDVTAQLSGTNAIYDAVKPWAYITEGRGSDQTYPYIDLLTGKVMYNNKENTPRHSTYGKLDIAPSEEVSFITWLIPHTDVTLPELVVFLSTEGSYPKLFEKSESISAKEYAMEVGSAYITNAYWDGEELSLEESEDNAEEIEVESVTFDRNNASISVGETLQIEATVLPEDATDKSLIWTSSNESQATVSQDGVVTGVSNGMVTITATAHNGESATVLIMIM